MEYDTSKEEAFGFDDPGLYTHQFIHYLLMCGAVGTADALPVAVGNSLAVLDKIEVNPAEFEIGDELGHGEFGACDGIIDDSA